MVHEAQLKYLRKRGMKKILSELIDEHIDRHRETLDLLPKPERMEMIMKGKEEIGKGIKGETLDKLKA